jgi:hypothetical protein
MSDDTSKYYGDNKDLVAITTLLITMVLKYGLPYVLDILNNINNGLITKEDIDAIKINKKPEDYFDK